MARFNSKCNILSWENAACQKNTTKWKIVSIRKSKVWVAIVMVAFGFSPSTRAADVYIEKNTLYLTGEIRQGDAERLASLMPQLEAVKHLMINSLGGDLAEAMRLAELVKNAHIDVRVGQGGYCVSACFFVFLEGYYRSATSANDDGTLMPQAKRERRAGVVGIHRPYLKPKNGDIASPKKQEELMHQVRAYLVSKSVAQHLIDEMMARPSNEIYWLRERDLELIGEYNHDVEEALISKCGYKRLSVRAELMVRADESWSVERNERMEICAFDYWSEQYLQQQMIFIFKLSTGWRPWSGK